MHIHLLFNGLAQVLDEMETVCDLQGLRCTLTCGLRISATTIPTDDFNLRVLPQPARTAFNAPIRKNINYGLPLEIDDDGSVSLRLAGWRANGWTAGRARAGTTRSGSLLRCSAR